MLVHFISAYYSERANKHIKKRPPEYWEAYMFVWAVKFGTYKNKFLIQMKNRTVKVTADNIGVAREMFGRFIAYCLNKDDSEVEDDVLLIPVPSKDALKNTDTYRSLEMLEEAMDGRDFEDRVTDGVRWTKKLAKSHEGGHHNRGYWKPHLEVIADVDGKDVVLIDDVLSTGGTLLAAMEVLEEAGANVLFAVVCGKTVYDCQLKPYGRQELELVNEIHEYEGE
ncbi:phosphoribosyltransferase [Rhizobium sp. Rhizsp42]|uniref:phosphoribosyltransferase n=1 Tax=Rhizobium sp. Rhizsp42 TaxID=3243034 RepID=UPI0039AFCBC2